MNEPKRQSAKVVILADVALAKRTADEDWEAECARWMAMEGAWPEEALEWAGAYRKTFGRGLTPANAAQQILLDRGWSQKDSPEDV